MSNPIIATFEVEYAQPDNAAGDMAAAVIGAILSIPGVVSAEEA
jgi:hypothetical protein